LPIVKKLVEDMRKEEFIPFVKAVKSRVEFVMMAHLVVDDIDTELPTSLSEKAYKLLREELRFTKLIITDDMQMKAIDDRYSVEEAAVMAINAGADIVEYKDMAYAKKALEGLKKAEKDQLLLKETVNDRYSRIMECKERSLKEYKPVYIPDLSKIVDTPQSQSYLSEVRKKIEELG
jgi:beta-N-acetylhexosaminidase